MWAASSFIAGTRHKSSARHDAETCCTPAVHACHTATPVWPAVSATLYALSLPVTCRGYDGKLKIGILPVSTFCSGHTFFVQRMPEVMDLKPYVVHATFQFSGTPGKRHRMRERLLWDAVSACLMAAHTAPDCVILLTQQTVMCSLIVWHSLQHSLYL